VASVTCEGKVGVQLVGASRTYERTVGTYTVEHVRGQLGYQELVGTFRTRERTAGVPRTSWDIHNT
jgi:hypothetical protein